MTKSFLKGLALAGIGALLLAAPATAQIKWHLGVGLNLPQGDLADEGIGNAGTGWGVHGGGTFGLGEGPLAVKANASYEMWGITDSDPSESWNMITVAADLVYNFGGEGKIKPYLLAGAHWAQLGASPDGFESESGIGFNGGAGLNFMLGSMGAFVEAKYNMTSIEFSGTDFDMNTIPIVFGLRF
jgi:hypothetical protein